MLLDFSATILLCIVQSPSTLSIFPLFTVYSSVFFLSPMLFELLFKSPPTLAVVFLFSSSIFKQNTHILFKQQDSKFNRG